MIEITTFRLRAGVTEDEFLAADQRVQQEFIPNHPGFVRRTTARGADGNWAVVTLWGSPDEADASAALARGDEVATAFAALIDETTLVMQRFEELPG